MRLACGITASPLALSACSVPPDSIPVSPTAGPGPATLAAFDAGVIFADVCLTRGPNFEDAVQGLSGFPFTQNANTGTFYHNRANLSVKVRPSQCSMVYGTKAPIDDVFSDLTKGTASVLAGSAPEGINVTSQVAADGVRYFRLGIFSPVQ